MNLLVSVITVVLNDKAGFIRTFESVRKQDYEYIEHIVIDGGSTDGTAEEISKHRTQLSFCVSEADKSNKKLLK